MLFGNKNFLPDTYFGDMVASEFCRLNVGALVCSNAFFIICGFNEKNLNMVGKVFPWESVTFKTYLICSLAVPEQL